MNATDMNTTGISSADFSDWIGTTETVHDDMSPSQLQAAAATFDDPILTHAGVDAIPPLWHWFYFLPRAAQSRLSADGHPERGSFMPPVPLPRRMFAGSRVSFLHPLRTGTPARRDGVIRNVTIKEGKSGKLAFVTVGYSIWQHDVHCIEEEQDIVYREPGAPVPAPVAQPLPPVPDDAWSRDVTADSRLLFRFSALTFNAHRIHYDRDYTTREEGYPGLVIHGPLTAVMLANLVRHHATAPLVSFSFRGIAPLFDLHPVRLIARRAQAIVQCDALAPDGTVALQATARLAE